MRLYLMVLAITGEQGDPVPSYLIQTDDGTNVLIDTGFSPEMIAMTRQAEKSAQYIRDVVPVREQLAALGIAPDAIHFLIATHFDPDHAGEHDAFPNAEIVVQREHYRIATQGADRRYTMNQAHWDAPGLRYRFVDGDTELLPGITLIETSGHVPGHQSVLVRLPQTGPVLLAIDAINHAGQRDPETRTVAGYDVDEPSTRASTRKLRDIEEREGVRLVIYGHDRKQWPTLIKAPEYYD